MRRIHTRRSAEAEPTSQATTTKRLRLALVVDSLSKGTYANLLGRLAVGLVETERVDVALVCYKDDPAPEWLPQAVEIHRLRTERASRSLIAILRFLRSEQPDVLLTRMVHLNLLGLGASHIARIARLWPGLLVIGHDHPAELSHGSNLRDNKWMAKLCYRFADGVIAVSPPVREDAVSWCRLDPRSVALVPNPIVPFAFLASDPPHQWLERGQPPVFLATGRLVAYKRFDLLIDAFAEIRRRHNARLIIVGEGPESRSLRSRIEQLRLANDAELVGWVADPREWAAHSIAFVLPSEQEGFGQVLTEAMSVHCPVIAADALGGGPRFVTDNGRYGLLVPQNDYAALIDAMERMLDSETRNRYAQLGSERIGAFSPLSCGHALVDFVESLLNGSGVSKVR